MPIFRFVAIAGSLLLALLFVADATLKSRGPLFTNNSEGLTRPEPVRTQTAQRAPEAPRKQEAKRAQEAPQTRAPALVPDAALQPAPAAKPVAPPIAEIGEAAEALPPAAQAETEVVTYPELPKPQPAEVAKAEVAQVEVAKTEVTKPEPAKPQAAKTETARTQTAKTDVAKAEVAKPVPARTEVAKAEVAKAEVAKADVAKTQSIKAEPVKAEPARTETAKIEPSVTEPTKHAVIKREAVTTAQRETQRDTARTAPTPKLHKQIARKPERGSRYAAYRDGQASRDDVPTVDNGYAYGVAPGRARAERQQSWGGEYGQSRYRF